jgi:hypothetical protein
MLFLEKKGYGFSAPPRVTNLRQILSVRRKVRRILSLGRKTNWWTAQHGETNRLWEQLREKRREILRASYFLTYHKRQVVVGDRFILFLVCISIPAAPFFLYTLWTIDSQTASFHPPLDVFIFICGILFSLFSASFLLGYCSNVAGQGIVAIRSLKIYRTAAPSWFRGRPTSRYEISQKNGTEPFSEG